MENSSTVEKVRTFTRATTYVRPMLGYPVAFFGKCYYNCHISIEPNMIHIVFSKPLEELYSEYHGILDTLRNDPQYIDEQDYPNYKILNFTVPTDTEEDFEMFLDSKFSKMTHSYKEHILSLYAQYKDAYRVLSRALYPKAKDREDLRKKLGVDIDVLDDKAEVISAINLRKEVLDIDEYKN
jgi:hypothetical protein